MNDLMRRRITELVGMLAVGDGVIAAIAPTEHAELWRGGPRLWDRTVEMFAKHPTFTRLLGLAEIGFGVWLMWHQVEPERRRVRPDLRQLDIENAQQPH